MSNATVRLSKRWTERTLVPCCRDEPRSCRRAPCYCVCCSFMRASRYTSTHIISCLYAPRRFTGTSEAPGGFLLLQAPLADTVATTPFMWLPRNTPNRQCYTHWQAVITGAPYCVSNAESDSSFSLPECAPQLAHVSTYSLIFKPWHLIVRVSTFPSALDLIFFFLWAAPYAVSAGFSLPI